MNKTVNKIFYDIKKTLKEQNNIDIISQQCSCSNNIERRKFWEELPQNIFVFTREAINL